MEDGVEHGEEAHTGAGREECGALFDGLSPNSLYSRTVVPEQQPPQQENTLPRR